MALPLSKKLIYALIPALALVAVAEVGARLLWDPLPPPPDNGQVMAPHPTRGWSLDGGPKSSAGAGFRTDAAGLRRVDPTGAPLRAITTGDSSIFGHGLSDADTLHYSLRDAFAQDGLHVDVFTVGTPGYTLAQSRVLMDEAGWRLRPDLVVVGNLWSDNDLEPTTDPERGHAAPRARFMAGLTRVSALAAWLAQAAADPDHPFHTVGWIQGDAPPGARRLPLPDYIAHLDGILADAHARGASVVVLTPCNRELAADTPPPPRGWPWAPYFAAVAQFTDHRGIPRVDGCAVARAQGLSDDPAFLDDMHPTGALNRAYAQALSRTVTAQGWPTSPWRPDLAAPPLQGPWDDPWHQPAQ